MLQRPCGGRARRSASASALLIGALLAGCATQSHVPQPLDPAAAQAAWQSATVDDDATRQALSRQGIDTTAWPLPAWDVGALTALALARHPDMAIARAELRQVEAAGDVATQDPSRNAEITAERHSDAAGQSPWTLGVVIDGLFSGAAQGAARSDEAQALATEAGHQAAQTAWTVRQRVRDAHRTLYFAEATARLARQQLDARTALAAAAQRRLDRGAIDAREAWPLRQAEAEARQQLAQAEDATRRARAALATAVALPAARLATLTLRFDGLDQPPPVAQINELQGRALLNRLDVRAAVARYAAADAKLRFELARQWPDLVLRPGYQWDQGDRIWSLGLAITWPPGGRNQAAIAAAQAQREAEAARFAGIQTAALAALEAAAADAEAARARSDAAERQSAEARQTAQRTDRRLAAGDADRPEALSAQVAALDAQRQQLEAQAALWAAHGALEDAVQRPLDAAVASSPSSTQPSATADAATAAGRLQTRTSSPWPSTSTRP